jgi:alpha-methylacyl-CoA racemase
MADGPLDGVTILDLASVGPAARASRWLADYGAAVVKVGPVPIRPDARTAPPYFAYGAHRSMRHIRVDLKQPPGVETFLRLAQTADVVIESFRPGVVNRLGVGYDHVRARNKAIVYCSTSGFGQDGPYAAWAGHDLDYLAVGGFLDCTGRGPDGGPALPGTTVADTAAGGMHAVIAITTALLRRARTGEGAYLDVSVADGVLALMSLQIDEYLATGAVPVARQGILTGRYACYDTYQARDGRWLSVAAIEAKFWANLCRALGLDRWIDAQLDDGPQDQIRADLRQVFASLDRDDWIRELAARDTCVAPVLSVAEVVADPHFVARGAFVAVTHPRHGRFRQVAPTLAGTTRPDPSGLVPDVDVTDTDDVLRAAGLSTQETQELREAGVVA